MVNELKLQTDFVKKAKKEGGWAIKTANRHIGGIPDIYMKVGPPHGVFIECKLGKLNLTALQRETLRRMHRAGQPAGWVMFKKIKNQWYVYVGANPDADCVEHCPCTPFKDIDCGTVVHTINVLSRKFYSE